MRLGRFWTACALKILIVCALPVLCYGENAAAQPQASEQDEILIGAAISLSGSFSAAGRYVRDGYEFAVDVINAKGGVAVNGRSRRIILTYRDDGSEASQATAIVEEMVNRHKVRLLLGPYSTQLAQAVEPIAERYNLPMIEAGAAGSSLFERGYRHLFGLLTTTEHYLDDMFTVASEKGAPRLRKKPSEIRVGMAVRDDQFSQDLREEVLSEIQKHDMRLVIDDRLPRDPRDMSMTLDRMKRLSPDMMVISGHEAAAIAALKHLRRQKMAVPMLVMTHCHSAKIAGLRRGSSEGVFCPTQWHPSLPYRDEIFGSASDYAAKFEKRFGYEPTYQSAQASAAVLVYMKAIENCGSTDPSKVREALADLNTETFYGPVDFDNAGRNAIKPMLLMQVVDGKYVMIAPGALGRAEPVIEPRPSR